MASCTIFVTGGVVSSLGKGIASAGAAALLQARGYTVKVRKLDPYLNIDPGTMSPYEHGECFVTDDGAETDLDLGHYERFTDRSATRRDSTTTGRIYQEIIQSERRGDYLGKTVQVIPHVSNAIKAFILDDPDEHDFMILEIGGTVGDIEASPFIEAIRQLRNDLPERRTLSIHLTLLPWIESAGELKTKPTQHSVRELQALGVQPDILMCRTDRAIPEGERRKIAQFCNVRPAAVIEARTVTSIYEIPEAYHAAGLDTQILTALGISPAPKPDLDAWRRFNAARRDPGARIGIALVGKYTALPDAYKSITEAFVHAGVANNVGVDTVWIDAETLEEGDEDAWARLRGADGILVPGGFGDRGIEGKIAAVRHAREAGVPYLGICLGFQIAVIEIARNVAGLGGAASSEFGEAREPVIAMMTEWMRGEEIEIRRQGGDLGGTMRLGAYRAKLAAGSLIAAAYGTTEISERHRHRYEVNGTYRELLDGAGLKITATSPDGLLPEAGEFAGHPWFVGVQYHPELKSRPFSAHPLFRAFVAAAERHATTRSA